MFSLLTRLGLRRRGPGNGVARSLVRMSQLALLHWTQVRRLVKVAIVIPALIRLKIPPINQFFVVIQHPYNLLFFLLVHA